MVVYCQFNLDTAWVADALLPGPPPVGTVMWLKPVWNEPEERMVVTELQLALTSISVDGNEYPLYYIVWLLLDPQEG